MILPHHTEREDDQKVNVIFHHLSISLSNLIATHTDCLNKSRTVHLYYVQRCFI